MSVMEFSGSGRDRIQHNCKQAESLNTRWVSGVSLSQDAEETGRRQDKNKNFFCLPQSDSIFPEQLRKM